MEIETHFTHGAIGIPPTPCPNREIGSSLEFRGIVREMENGQALAGLFYEAHEPMARRQLERHFQDIGQAHPVASVSFIHRLGWVPVGEASLYICVLSAHRSESLAFLAEAIVRLKKDVPIWKLLQAPSPA